MSERDARGPEDEESPWYIRSTTTYKKADMSFKAKVAGPAAVPRPGEGKRGPEGHLGYLVRQANSAVRAAMEKVTGRP